MSVCLFPSDDGYLVKAKIYGSGSDINCVLVISCWL